MTKLKAPLLSLGATGTLAKTITFIKRFSHNIAERKPHPSDPSTTKQKQWRHMYSKCAALWHTLNPAEQLIWDNLARAQHMSGFALWQSQCLRPNPGIYLPLQGGTMSGDIDMATKRILSLPDPLDAQQPVTLAYLINAMTAAGIHPNARVYRDTNIAMEDEEMVPLPFTHELWDNDNIWGAPQVLSILKCHTAGLYSISATLSFETDPNGYRGLAIWLNTAIEIASIKLNAATTGPTALSLGTQYYLNIDDYLELCPFHDQHPTLDILALPDYSPHFMICHISS